MHWQLMLNYCFGHRHSSLLLCPYGVLASFINHSQKRNNTKVQWSQKAMAHPEWLEQPLDDWVDNFHNGLAFELIATRDIRKGEEVLLDYGNEWEAAWRQHVSSGNLHRMRPRTSPPTNATKPTCRMNRSRPWKKACTNLNRCYLLVGKSIVKWWASRPVTMTTRKHCNPCRVVKRYQNGQGDYRYLVELTKDTDDDTVFLETAHEVLFDVPRDAFLFSGCLLHTDHAQSWSFRHDIRIPGRHHARCLVRQVGLRGFNNTHPTVQREVFSVLPDGCSGPECTS